MEQIKSKKGIKQIITIFAAMILIAGMIVFLAGCDSGTPVDAEMLKGTWEVSASEEGMTTSITHQFNADGTYSVRSILIGGEVNIDMTMSGTWTTSGSKVKVTITVAMGIPTSEKMTYKTRNQEENSIDINMDTGWLTFTRIV